MYVNRFTEPNQFLPCEDVLTNDVLEEFPPPIPGIDYDPDVVTYDFIIGTFTIDASSLSSIASPLGNHLARFKDYTSQLGREFIYGVPLIGFPTDDD